jgi:hypothetical protein
MSRQRTIDSRTSILVEETMRLLASDYPFDMGNLDCVARVRALSIEPATRDLILGGYAAPLFGEPARSPHA